MEKIQRSGVCEAIGCDRITKWKVVCRRVDTQDEPRHQRGVWLCEEHQDEAIEIMSGGIWLPIWHAP